jgi:hypothetical protein
MSNKQLGLIVTLLAAGAVLLSACGGAEPAAHAGEPAPGRTVTVVGQGQANGTPDVAHISIGVETTGATTKEAVVANKQRMTALLEKLKALGIAAKDIQTSNYAIYTEQLTPEMSARPVDGKGGGAVYHVSNQVNVTVRDISKLGDILDEAVNEGANTVYGVSFEVADPSPLQAQAREKAIADAKARADSLAKLAGVSVAQVLAISEVIGNPIPMFAYDKAAGMGGGGAPIQPGEFQVSVSVQVTYAIK